MSLNEKLCRLATFLGQRGDIAVAFSGGTDSAFLLAAALRHCPGKVAALTVKTPYIQQAVLEETRSLAQKLCAEHIIITLDNISDEIIENPPDRCYRCKSRLFQHIIDISKMSGITSVADGSNCDDLNDYRPGLRAVRELGVQSPLLECGFTKRDIREASKNWGLDTWDKAPGTCLLTRLPYNFRIDEETLRMVEKSESFIAGMGFSNVRVRTMTIPGRGEGNGEKISAKIEVSPDEIGKITENRIFSEISAFLEKSGYSEIEIDAEGYVMGKMNKSINTAVSCKQGRTAENEKNGRNS